jgi:hypothetical protein
MIDKNRHNNLYVLYIQMEIHEDIASNLIIHNLQLRGRFAVTCKLYYNKLQKELGEVFNLLYPSIDTAIIRHNTPAICKFMKRVFELFLISPQYSLMKQTKPLKLIFF